MTQESNAQDIILELRSEEEKGLLGTKKDSNEELSLNENLEEFIQMKGILELFPFVIFNWKNEDDWPVEYVSENVSKLTGYTREEFKTGLIHYSDIIHAEDIARVTEEVENNSKNSEVTEFEHNPYRIITKTGETRWVQDFTSIRRNDEGNITNYRGIVQDITELTELRNKLKEKDRIAKLVVENTNDCIWQTDLNLNFSFVNPAIQNLSGYTPEEWMAKDIQEFITDESFTNLKKAIESQLDLLPQLPPSKVVEANVIHKDGRIMPVEATLKVIFDKSGKPIGLQGVTRDISHRKKNERTLHFRFQIQKVISTISSTFIEESDFDDSVSNSLKILGEFVQADRAYLFLKDKENLVSITHDWCNKNIPSRKDELQNVDFSLFPWMKEKLERGEIIWIADVKQLPNEATAELDILREYNIKNQLLFPIIIRQKYRGVIGVDNLSLKNDITKEAKESLSVVASIIGSALIKNQIEKTVLEKERQYRLLSETIPVAVYSLDDETPHQINFITDMISAITGYDKEEFITTSLLQDIIFEEDKQRIDEARLESITKKNTFSEEYRIITKQQKMIWIKDRFNPVLDEDGNIVQLNGFLEDISLRKDFEQDLQEKIAQLQRYKKVTVGRELKMIELKKQIARLENQLRSLSTEQNSLNKSEVLD